MRQAEAEEILILISLHPSIPKKGIFFYIDFECKN